MCLTAGSAALTDHLKRTGNRDKVWLWGLRTGKQAIFVLHLNEQGPATAEAIPVLLWLLGCPALAGDLAIPQLQARSKEGRRGAAQGRSTQ